METFENDFSRFQLELLVSLNVFSRKNDMSDGEWRLSWTRQRKEEIKWRIKRSYGHWKSTRSEFNDSGALFVWSHYGGDSIQVIIVLDRRREKRQKDLKRSRSISCVDHPPGRGQNKNSTFSFVSFEAPLFRNRSANIPQDSAGDGIYPSGRQLFNLKFKNLCQFKEMKDMFIVRCPNSCLKALSNVFYLLKSDLIRPSCKSPKNQKVTKDGASYRNRPVSKKPNCADYGRLSIDINHIKTNLTTATPTDSFH